MSGFSFLLVLLTFFLLRAEQKREQEPRPLIIKMIWRFMLMTIFMVLVNGFISLPLFNQNAKLHESVTQLSNNNNEEITNEIAQNADEIEDLISTPKTNEDSIQNAMQQIINKQNQALDSIKATLIIANSTEERITEIDNLKQEMAVNYKVLLNPNVDKSTKMEANQNLKVLNTDLKRIAIASSK